MGCNISYSLYSILQEQQNFKFLAKKCKGIEEFEKKPQANPPPVLPTPRESQLNSLVKVLETANSTGAISEGPPSRSISFERALASLSKKLVEQIRANQYVDFAELPPARGQAKSVSQLLAGEGQVVLLQSVDLAKPKKVIPSFAIWSQCFLLYLAALSPSQGRLRNLMAYQLSIARCSVKYKWPAWVVYDQNFCSEVANQPDCLWAISDPDLYGQAFTNKLVPLLYAQGIN